jgi:hypothetical protein
MHSPRPDLHIKGQLLDKIPSRMLGHHSFEMLPLRFTTKFNSKDPHEAFQA